MNIICRHIYILRLIISAFSDYNKFWGKCMKKFFIIFTVIIWSAACFAEDALLEGGVTFDWLTVTQEKRDNAVEYFKSIVFADTQNNIKKPEFRKKYSEFLKDANYKKHYMLANEGFKETEKYNICAFQTKAGVLLIYAIQYKDNLQNTYYYDAYGHLRYVDEISENYPEFPYYTIQYRANGNIVSAVYVESRDIQYIYKPNGKFKGIWYKDKMFNQKAKQILTRTNW